MKTYQKINPAYFPAFVTFFILKSSLETNEIRGKDILLNGCTIKK